MSKTVEFGMFWQAYGYQSIELPDEIDEKDMDAVKAYINEHWDEIPLPTGDYVTGSDELDTESIQVTNTNDPESPKEDVHFSDDGMAIWNNKIRVEWCNLGEGWCGDYNPDDPEDENLLRFDVYIKWNGEWETVEDASYCTRMPADTDTGILRKALRLLLKEYTNVLGADPYDSVRALGMQLSWIEPNWFEEITVGNVRDGIRLGTIQFIRDPNETGSLACKIGEHWFYLDTDKANGEMTPEQYVRNVSLEEETRDVFNTLNSLKDEFHNEYLYYAAYLDEALNSGKKVV